MLGALTAVTLPMCGRRCTHGGSNGRSRGERPARGVAALLGGLIGVLLVADPTLGWGVHGAHPAFALLPSVIGSFWGGYYLWNFYDAIPRELRGVSLKRAGGIAHRSGNVDLRGRGGEVARRDDRAVRPGCRDRDRFTAPMP